MNNLMQPSMPRMQPQMQSALTQTMPGGGQQQQQQPLPAASTPGNALQGTSTPSPIPSNGILPVPPPIGPQQVQEVHDHLHDMQQTLNELIKKPDNELNTKSIFRAAADMVVKHQIHSGKKGIPAAAIASELSSPDFPKADQKGNPPPPAAVRTYLQNHFDQAVMHQAQLTQKFGPPIPHIKQE